MVRSTTRFAALAVLLALPLGACDDTTGPEGQARLSIFITDAPGDVTAAFVTISRVELLGTPSGPEDESVLVLTDVPWTGDLVQLQDDVDLLVNDASIPEGTYHQLRIVIPEACIEVETETGTAVYSSSSEFDACGQADGTLQMPSFGASGLKIILPGGGMDLEGTQVLLMDFDVAESFSTGHQAGQSGTWVLSPVIRLEPFESVSNVQVNVSLDAGVTLPTGVSLEDLRVSLDDERSKALDASGQATFGYVMEGQHEISLVLPDGATFGLTTDPVVPHTFDVVADIDATVELTITAVI